MCGIIGAVATQNITASLITGLKLLEYRGYDSSGIALIKDGIKRYRALGKISELEKIITKKNLDSNLGIAHTRWATHGEPSKKNAHPHICNNEVAVVHNGIIENYIHLKKQQLAKGYNFTSQTDTEVIAHAIYEQFKTQKTLLEATSTACKLLQGSYAIAVVSLKQKGHLVATCNNATLVIGVAKNKYFIASDTSALLHITRDFIFLEDGQIADITYNKLVIYNKDGNKVIPSIKTSKLKNDSIALGTHKHYMHKEIFEQPQAIIDILSGRCNNKQVIINAFGYNAYDIFLNIDSVQIIACGTSYHAGLVSKYWFEDIISMPCAVEVASEYRYRNPVILKNTLFVTLSQSGETADTVEALINAQKSYKKLHTLAICNTPESRLTRISELTFLTHAGPEISVASTKAFSSQLVALALLITAIGKTKGTLSKEREKRIVSGLYKLPKLITSTLKQESVIAKLAVKFSDKYNALFLGRGIMYPIAKEGALKLKEVSYIHAEAYPAGELKHGPIALIDNQIPVIAIAPKNDLLAKLKSNLQEVKSRGSQMIVFEDKLSKVDVVKNMEVITITENVGPITAPIVFNISLQLLSYHVALIKGTDVDKPRNLAKSVTVE